MSLSTFNFRYEFPLEGEPPTEIILWEKGVNPSTKLPEKVYNENSAKAITEQWQAWGRDIAFTYEHDFHKDELPGYQKKAAAWGKVDASPERCRIYDIRYTPMGRQVVKDKEFRYLSAEFHVKNQKEITALNAITLTNYPSTLKAKPLLESLLAPTKRTKSMKISEMYDGLSMVFTEAQEAAQDTNEEVSGVAKSVLEYLAPAISLLQEHMGAMSVKENLAQVKKLIREQSKTTSGLVGSLRALISQAKYATELESQVVSECVAKGISQGKIAPTERVEMESMALHDVRAYLENRQTVKIKQEPTVDKSIPSIPVVPATAEEIVSPEVESFLSNVRNKVVRS